MSTVTSSLIGVWTLQIEDGQNLAPYSVVFNPNNEVVCPLLGSIGRYHQNGNFVIIAFGNSSSFIFDTEVMFYGQLVGGEMQGIVSSASKTYISARWAASQTGIPYIPQAPMVGLDLTHAPFHGIELPHNVSLSLDFRGTISGNEFGDVTLTGPTGSKVGKYLSYKFDSTSQQLVVFAFDRLCTYGGIVLESNGKISLSGQYMNVLNGGATGTWDGIN